MSVVSLREVPVHSIGIDTVSKLSFLGFSELWLGRLQALEPADRERCGRVTCQRRGEYVVGDEAGQHRAVLAGKLRLSLAPDEAPCVGDWVVFEPGEPARIRAVLERTNVLRRREVGGSSRAQPIAANVTRALIVAAFGEDSADPHALAHALNQRRLERYLRAARDAALLSTVVLNKADLVRDAGARAAELSDSLAGVPVLAVSALDADGVEALAAAVGPGETAVFVGSSGVGKSSLTNRLLGAASRRVSAVRDEDARGRHTTTERELFALPGGGVIIDTPGMRELALFADAESDVSESGFDDIESFAARCRFRDCRHAGEPGCAVRDAVERGELAAARIDHANRLTAELEYQKARHDARLRQEERKRAKGLSRAVRERLRDKQR